MTMHLDQLVATIEQLHREDLEAWMRESLVHATGQADEPVFSEAECARVRLICSLHYDMEIETGALPVVLELVDQLHEARQQIRALGSAVLAQDVPVRSAILSRLIEDHE